MRRFGLALATALLLGPSIITAGPRAQKSSAGPQAGAAARFELTVDGIMRGPKLVGWPPTALRWSADSQHLYFEWRKPGEEEASTYVVAATAASRAS